jgi:hypothetical protein
LLSLDRSTLHRNFDDSHSSRIESEIVGASSSTEKLFGNSPPLHPEVKVALLRRRIPDLPERLKPHNLYELTVRNGRRVDTFCTVPPIRIV